MLHSNAGELHQLFSTFNRVWGAGGDASLSLKTVDGKVSAVLDVQLGPPSSPRPGAPEAHQQVAGSLRQQPGQRRRRRHRGPGRQARDAARLEAWRKRRLESQQLRPPPPADETPAEETVLPTPDQRDPDHTADLVLSPLSLERDDVDNSSSPEPTVYVCDRPHGRSRNLLPCGQTFKSEHDLRCHGHRKHDYCYEHQVRYDVICPSTDVSCRSQALAFNYKYHP